MTAEKNSHVQSDISRRPLTQETKLPTAVLCDRNTRFQTLWHAQRAVPVIPRTHLLERKDFPASYNMGRVSTDSAVSCLHLPCQTRRPRNESNQRLPSFLNEGSLSELQAGSLQSMTDKHGVYHDRYSKRQHRHSPCC